MLTHPKLLEEKSGEDLLGCANVPDANPAAATALATNDVLKTDPNMVALLRCCGSKIRSGGALSQSVSLVEGYKYRNARSVRTAVGVASTFRTANPKTTLDSINC
jgi:hypothetical protein